MDRALLRGVSDEVAQLPDGAANLTNAWSDGGGMWFVQVQPREPRAALLSVAFDGDDLLMESRPLPRGVEYGPGDLAGTVGESAGASIGSTSNQMLPTLKWATHTDESSSKTVR